MYTIELIRDLYHHMEWADAFVWKRVTERPGAAGDEELQSRLRHLHGTQQYFLKVWRAEEISYDKVEIPFEEELPLVRRFYDDVWKYLGPVVDEDLSREMNVPWAKFFARRVGKEHPGSTTLGETMYQVAAHSTYHRGQVNTRLKQSGGAPPLVDYIAWLWLERPNAEWP